MAGVCGSASLLGRAVAIMSESISSADLQERACKMLWSRYLSWKQEEIRGRIGSAGGIEAILRAMTQHPSAAGVQEWGCVALSNLAVNADNKVKIGSAGGIEAIVRAMTQHPSAAGVQEHGCVALWNLAANNAHNKSKINAAGGAQAIRAAMAAHTSSSNVQSWGKGALGCL